MRTPLSRLGFALFLLVNATLIIRPAEIIEELAALPIYEFLILGAVAASYRPILYHLQWPALKQQPITLCAVGMLFAVAASHASHLYLYGLRTSTVMFAKTLVYYLLFVAVVDTPKRMRAVMLVVAVVSTITVGLCVLDYMQWMDIKFIKHIKDHTDMRTYTGEELRVERMKGTGLFEDPNDISLLIVAAGVLCTYFLTDPETGPLRFFWLGPLCVLGSGLLCTHSRGGLLSALAAGGTIVLMRLGGKWAVAGAVAALAMLPAVASRQTQIDLSSGTGHERLLLWRDGFQAIKSPNLLFGIGEGMYADYAGLVAHNSFIHAYVELGIVGGTLFFGCFFFAALGFWRLWRMPQPLGHREMRRMLPFAAALTAGWATGLLTLSRTYVVPTFMILGFAAAYLNYAAMLVRPCGLLLYWNRRAATQLILASGATFTAFYLFVYVFAR
ncbi:MAG: O-antigen ligase domain-containing protein [Planctomycetota bacterium]|nr:MAG: O-antigen ligase domain-containing protein [Planctomycetota bacterium]